MINLENIFSLFEKKDISQKEEKTYIDFQNSPLYWIGMFKTVILKRDILHKRIDQIIDQTDVKNKDDTSLLAGDFFIFNRAWDFISLLDITNPEHLSALQNFDLNELKESLNLIIDFFIQSEEYEKCSFLTKILKEIES